jgi:WhiA C-terminal HTH domain
MSWDAAATLLKHAGATHAASQVARGPVTPGLSAGVERFGQANRSRTESGRRPRTQVQADLDTLAAYGHVLTAGMQAVAALRLAHPEASLGEVAARADPLMTKNALAGQLRRVHVPAVAVADQHR